MLKVETLAVGPLQSNCHLLYDGETREAVIIDAGAEGSRIIRTVETLGLDPKCILITHAHGDHIGANGEVRERFDIPILAHENEAHMLEDAAANLSLFAGFHVTSPPADETFAAGETIPFGGRFFKVLDVSGHSPGGSALLIDTMVFPGDALFRGSVGRTDFPGGSHEQLMRNIMENLMTLPDDTMVYPGHGPSTTIGYERKNNPYLHSFLH